MNLSPSQEKALDHLRRAYTGPESEDEVIVNGLPNRQYAVGMLYPQGAAVEMTLPTEEEETSSSASGGEAEELGAAVPIAEEWRPSSVAISFVIDGSSAHCHLSGGTYEAVDHDGPPSWRRKSFSSSTLTVADGGGPIVLEANGVKVEVGSRWRRYGHHSLVTVYVRSREIAENDNAKDIPKMLFQVSFQVEPGKGSEFLEYKPVQSSMPDEESEELKLRYRNRKVFAVGHGMAADWSSDAGRCTRVSLEPVPAFVVPAVEAIGFEPHTPKAEALSLSRLAKLDSEPESVLTLLKAFVSAFEEWALEEASRVPEFERDQHVAQRIVDRSTETAERMRKAVDRLGQADQGDLRRSFALGMTAMRLQMRQSQLNRDPGKNPPEPQWRPFQLGFILLSLLSAVDDNHKDRELVDLIWFPTGGGKTEAYLGLAAIEIFRRRIVDGPTGGGTAVITRYTLRLLTAQQFQRTASLICAMESLRLPGPLHDARTRGMAPFTIGLWVGNQVTPATSAEAKRALERLHKAAHPEEANSFQIQTCPWCSTALIPASRNPDKEAYGIRLEGRGIVIHCTNASCIFHRELPVQVVDEDLYESPPTVVLATVDKFARLQFNTDAGSLLGLGTPYRQPSLVIQDELHLLSGPLGTTVGAFDAVIQVLLTQGGSSPKLVASTATIRASQDQVRGLYGREVRLYPPSGLDDDRTFFSRPVQSGEGRLYLGLMPQSLSQMSSVVSAAAPLLEVPRILPDGATNVSSLRDDYWTAVIYHNSLRELGRTSTLVRDDINARLNSRAERLGIEPRSIRADRVLELTSRRGPEELPQDLRALSRSADETDDAVDAVLSSNMLSVGVDIPRLALMLMVGQPKTTAEYIQSTSRVGRGKVKGIVTTLFRSNRARDRSHFETFRGYHEALYKNVEPTSVTPWSRASRERSLPGVLVTLLRHTVPALREDESALRMDLGDELLKRQVDHVIEKFLQVVNRAEPDEADLTQEATWRILRQWHDRAALARSGGQTLFYGPQKSGDPTLLKRYGQEKEGYIVGDSMRSVEPNVTLEVREPFQERYRGTNQT